MATIISEYLTERADRIAIRPPKISKIDNLQLSTLLPYGSIIITSSVLFIVLLSNIMERWLLRMIYGDIYRNLEKGDNERRRRSFTYYHIGALLLILLFCIGVYPVLDFLVGPAHFSTTLRKGGSVTFGDMMFMVAEIYCAYYIFEMCFRTQFASPLTIAHHVGLLLITQTAIALFAIPGKHKDATLEFYMCMVWGAFDVVTEIPVFISMIVWRVQRKNHRVLSLIGFGCCVWIVIAATTETIVTIYLLSRSWGRWSTDFRVVTPIIFILWISTQLYGASRLYSMGAAERREYHKKHSLDIESVDSDSNDSESTKRIT